MSEGSRYELDWLLDKLSASVAGVQHAVILSPDGLPLGRSPGLSVADADTLAADAEADHRQIAYELAVLVKRVGQHMVADPRFPVRDTV